MAGNIIYFGDSHAATQGRAYAQDGDKLSEAKARHPISTFPAGSDVIISIGTNDLTKRGAVTNGGVDSQKAKQIAQEIYNFALQTQQAGHRVVITGLPRPSDGYQNWSPAFKTNFKSAVDVVNAELQRLAGASQGAVQFSPTATQSFKAGDIHLTTAGYAQMFGDARNLLNGVAPAPQQYVVNNAAPVVAPAPEAKTPAVAAPVTESLKDILNHTLDGAQVRKLQQKLGVTVDGKFGPQTLAALRTAMGAEDFTSIPASNWAMFARAARDEAAVNFIKEKIAGHDNLKQAIAGNVGVRVNSSAGLAARQMEGSLAVLGFMPAANIDGMKDAVTTTALSQFRTAYPNLLPAVAAQTDGVSSKSAAEVVIRADGIKPAVVYNGLVQQGSHGDISNAAWAAAKSAAVQRVLGRTDETNSLNYVSSNPGKLVVIDLGHNDMTEGQNRVATGAQAANGMTEAEMTDIQGRALAQKLKAQGYTVVFTRAPGEVMDIPEFANMSTEAKKGKYARVRGEMAEEMAKSLGFAPQNTLLISLHFDQSAPASGGVMNANNLHGFKALYDPADPRSRALAQRMVDAHGNIAPDDVDTGGIVPRPNLGIMQGGITTVLLESEFMSPQGAAARQQMITDGAQSWASKTLGAINQFFGGNSGLRQQIAHSGPALVHG